MRSSKLPVCESCDQSVFLEFARAHDENMWRGLCTILEVPTTAYSRNARDLSSLPLSLGGLGLRSATRTRVSAYWASWVDTLGKLGGHIAHGAEPTVGCTFVQIAKKTHPKTLSPTNIFIQKHFHPTLNPNTSTPKHLNT